MGFVRDGLRWVGRLFRARKANFYRVAESGKPRFQLRHGEEGLSVFDARRVKPEDILPSFRPGSLVFALDVAWIESFGLRVVKTPGDPRLPKLLQDNHAIICPPPEMTRKEFKQTLKGMEAARRG